MSFVRLFTAIVTLLVVYALSGLAVADEMIEEIIVRAELRDTTLSELAASATVIDPAAAGTTVQHLEEILNRAPNVNFASGASRGRFVQIRGVGERGQFSEPLNSSVGLVVDGVDLSGIGTAATLFDVAQVEILRGPQGTLYGANALAGLINIVTADPGDEFEAMVRMDAGDYGAFGLGAAVSGPLGERGGYRVSGQRYRDDGFMDNEFLGRENTNNHDERSYRAKIVWRGASADWKLVAGQVDVDNGYDAFSLDNDRDTLSDQPGQDQQQTSYGAVSVDWQMNDAVSFQSVLSAADSEIDYGYDEDWTFTGFHPWEYSSTDRYRRDRTTVSMDARWLSNPGHDSGGWDWVAGVYGLRQEVDLVREYTFLGGPFGSDYEIERLAAYGELSRPFSELWRVSIGLRYERHGSEYDDAFGLSFDPDDDLLGGRVLLGARAGQR